MLAHVGHALVHGGSVAMRSATTDGKEAEKGEEEVHCWLGKLERNISSLNQTGSKTLKVTKTKENVTTGWGSELTGWKG
jgi:hypothetical protein